MSEETATIDQPKTYPVPTSDGWVYQDDKDEALKIETITHENGSVMKRVTLSDGRIAKCRRLKGKDQKTIQRIIENDKDKAAAYQNALIAVSTTIDEKGIVIEDLDSMWLNDYNAIMIMSTGINF